LSAVEALHARLNLPLPAPLREWDAEVAAWCDAYVDMHSRAELSEINLGFAVFQFDHIAERVTLAYALSVPQLLTRNKSRMRGFPDVNVSVRAVLADHAFIADRGHFLGHASGGELDINLFPQRRELNRGWSAEGRRFRQIERYVAAHPGCFFYHRPRYDDASWIPASLELGVLKPDGNWWRERFQNKNLPASNRAEG